MAITREVRADGLYLSAYVPDAHGRPVLVWVLYDPDTGAPICVGRDKHEPTGSLRITMDALARDYAARRARSRQEHPDWWDWADMPLYLRYGDLPPGGRSVNGLTGTLEAGTSVYGACWDPVEGVARIDEDAGGGRHPTIAYLVAEGRPVYLVTGQRVGYGSDGEPLIRAARILARLHWDQAVKGYRPDHRPCRLSGTGAPPRSPANPPRVVGLMSRRGTQKGDA